MNTDLPYFNQRKPEPRLYLYLGLSIAVHLVALFFVGSLSFGVSQSRLSKPIEFIDLNPKGFVASPKPVAAPKAVPAAPQQPIVAKPEPKPVAPPVAPIVAQPTKAPSREIKQIAAEPPKPAAASSISSNIVEPSNVPLAPPKPDRTYGDIRQKLEEMKKSGGAPAPVAATPRAANPQQAIEEIKKQFAPAPPTPAEATPGEESGVVGEMPSVLTSRIQEMRYAAYRNQIWEHVGRNWIMPPFLKGRGLSAVVFTTVDRSGFVQKAWIQKTSGNSEFDRAALNAVNRASPIPPFPPDLPDSATQTPIGFRFTE